MSYEVLARKWRPKAFDDVVGQAHVTTPLRNAIRMDRMPHAVLFTGPRGCGKTTLARILARCLNCEEGPTDTPCGECDSCREIIEGRSTDVQEIDAASRTSVDDVREIIEAVRYAPSPGKYRIYVVDEVHMLSGAAFNALLKTLEEPPPRSVFVFATTNPEKIPFTVISRCQRHDLRRIGAAEIVGRLQEMCRDESLIISETSLLAIAREADGSMRDAQTLLDQIIAFGGEKIDDEQVAQVLDLVDRRMLLAIADACIAGNAAAALDAIVRASETGADAKRLGETLLQLLRDLVVLRVAPDHEGLVEASDAELAELKALAERTDATRLRRMFRSLVREQEDLGWAPRPMAVLEMAVVRLASMPDGDDVGRLLVRLDALEKRIASGGTAGGGSGGDNRPAPRNRQQRAPSNAAQTQAAPVASAPPPEVRTSAQAAPSAEEPPPPSAKHEPPDASAPLDAVFSRLCAFTERHNPRLVAALDNCSLLERGESHIRLAAPNRFAAQRLESRREALEGICAELFGHAMRVRIDQPDEHADTAENGESGSEADRKARQRALEHPTVGLAVEVLGGEISEIRPLSPGGAGR